MIVDGTIDDLRQHAPFDRMDRKSLAFLAERFKLAYFAKGRKITGPDYGIARILYIVQRGLVLGERNDSTLVWNDTIEYAAGECFPVAEVVGKQPAGHVFVALEDSFCYEVGVDDVETLMRMSEPFGAFCSNSVDALLVQSHAMLQTFHAQQSKRQQPMNAFLRDLVHREPVSCPPGEKMKNALEAMQRAKVGSIVVTGNDGAPIGIFTERDLLRHTVGGFLDLARPIEAYMTPSPRTLPETATASEAAVLMVRLGIRHVVVVAEGRLTGVISERDLFALQRTSMRNITHSIEIAKGEKSLRQAATDIHKLAGNMIAQGIGAEQLTQLIATLNDKLTCRIIEIETALHDLGDIDFCWMAFGSEGRLEQTLSTDQDNGIIFSDRPSHGSVRDRLLPFARAVNRMLDYCGFPLCKGEIMAGNPQWCLSVSEWRQKFADWVRNPQPQAMLNSMIFFDLRSLWGREDLVRGLHDWLVLRVHDDQRFLRAMAKVAMDSRPPLGFFNGFVTSDTKGAANTIDLKMQGTRPFVDAARIYALASGLEQTSTSMRLRISGERLHVPVEETEAMVEAFHFMLLFRLRHQFLGVGPEAQANLINPDTLNELDRRILKEAFRQARKLQNRLSLDYQL
jgi:CBS domain-containing protein